MTATSDRVTLAHRVRCSSEVLVQEVGGETVLLDLAGERYFGLDPVGSRIWALVAAEPRLDRVHAALCGEFAAGPERIEQDLLQLVRQLSEAGLVEVE